MSSHRQPTSLQVQANRNASESSGYPSTATEDAALLRESRQFRRDMEREAERWVDVLMESPSVDRRFLRRASLYLQPNLYDEVTHERHLVMTCSYPTCSNRPHRPFSDEAKWRITKSTTHNISIRGPNKRDIVEVAGNPEDGFCSPACTIRSRWYRSRLNVEPIWARLIVNAGDLKRFQTQLKEGHKVEAMPEEVDLLEDMEVKGEITIENGQIRRVDRANISQQTSANSSDGPIKETGAEDRSELSRKTEPIPKTELVAESREKPSSLMQRLEKTLAGLRIVEKAETAGHASQALPEPPSQSSQYASSSSTSSPASAPLQTKQPVAAAPQSARPDNAKPSCRQSSGPTTNALQTPKRSTQRRTQTENGGDDSLEEESEDEETRMVFDLALAARGQLDDGTF